MKSILFFRVFLVLLLISSSVSSQERPLEQEKEAAGMSEIRVPQPESVVPGVDFCDQSCGAPSDAIILFDGKDLSHWESVNGGKAEWPVHEGVFTVDKKKGNIRTVKEFRDFQLHIEWQIPEELEGTEQSRGNSGIFLQGMYEIQVLDGFNNPTYYAGCAGSIYKQSPPLANVTRKPGKWNVYDIIYTAPTFKKDGTYRTYPYVTVILNGVIIQNHTRILGETVNAEIKEHGNGPIILQAHRDPTATNVSFRNIWIREL